MTKDLQFRNYYLKNLEGLIKPVWNHSDRWRLFKGKIEFSILCSDGERDWFPLCVAPENVVRFVKAWCHSGGLSFEDKENLVTV